MKYIIKIDSDFYLGNTYIYQHQVFPTIGRKFEAKRYKSKGLAIKVKETLSRNCENSSKYSILEVEE